MALTSTSTPSDALAQYRGSCRYFTNTGLNESMCADFIEACQFLLAEASAMSKGGSSLAYNPAEIQAALDRAMKILVGYGSNDAVRPGPSSTRASFVNFRGGTSKPVSNFP